MLVRRSKRQSLCSWALSGSTWVALACGTDHIELRRLDTPAAEHAAADVVPDAESPDRTPIPSSAPATLEMRGAEPRAPLDTSALPATSLEVGCTKVDFLFAIDNSSSMRDEQANLVRSFPAFLRVVQQVLEARDFHIMVVSTGGRREDEGEPTLDPQGCEDVQGAGRRHSPEGLDCGIQGGLSYLVNGQPELEATFSCAAGVGTNGDASEEPMEAILAAVSPTLNAQGRCNAGFLRQDALLVVTLITDEEDRSSSGAPGDWRRLLLDVKRGNELALVVQGLVGDNNIDEGLLGGPCAGADADGAPRLQQFVSSLDGVLGSVCAADYEPFFRTAAGKLHSACRHFVSSGTP